MILSALPLSTPLHGDEVVARIDAELLRIESGKLYLWLGDSLSVNGDFLVDVASGGTHLFSVPVAASLDRIVVSEEVKDSLLVLLRQEYSIAYSLSLSRSAISPDTLLVGVPLALVNSYSAAIDSSLLSGTHYRYVAFADVQEAEIELALGNIDILLLPATESTDRIACDYPSFATADFTEWYLLTDLPDYSLLPAALSYCLKGFLSADSVPRSYSFSSREPFLRHFPRQKQQAASLFEQLAHAIKSNYCFAEHSDQFPALVRRIKDEARGCGGDLMIGNREPVSSIALVQVVRPSQADIGSDIGCYRLLSRYADDFRFSWSGAALEMLTLDSTAQYADTLTCLEQVSSMLASNLHLIPLGCSRLMLVTRPGVQLVRYHDNPVSPRNFYMTGSR